MMSMKGDGKPVSFIEDCAVPLEHLAEYTDRLTRVFEKHGTRGTWYAHASVGTLHVRPILDMQRDGAEKMRAIAEEACAHGEGVQGRLFRRARRRPGALGVDRAVLRPAPHRARSARSSRWLDPKGLMNPGKIVKPPRMDDRALFRFKPGYATRRCRRPRSTGANGAASTRPSRCATTTATAASSTPAPCARRTARRRTRSTSRAAARTRCASRSRTSSAPKATEAVKAALDLCVSCKGCKRECPTGVDMARMKVEFLAHYKAQARPDGARPR